MRKFTLFGHRTAFFWPLTICTSFLFTINSCRKTDSTQELQPATPIESRFFSDHASAAPELLAIADLMKRQNDKDPFIEKLVTNAGYPIWDKAMLMAKNNDKSKGPGGGAAGNKVIYIPFAKDGQQVVSAAIRVTMTPAKDTLIKVLLASKYLDTVATGMKPRQLSLLLMKLDNLVYGRNLYRITDHAAFSGLGKNVEYVRIADDPSFNTGKLIMTIYTFTVCYTVTYPGFCDGQVHGVGPGENPYCTEYLCESISWTEWEDDGGGGGGGGWPDPGGGGGGGGNNPNPCRPIPTIGGDPCGGGQGSGGWVPEPVDDDTVFPPCDRTDQTSGATATVQYLSLASTVSQFAAFDPNTNSQAEQYFLVNNVGGAYIPGSVQTLPTTGGSMQGVTSALAMVVHTHPYGGYPFPSAADLFGMANFTSGFMMNYVIAYDGTKYAMVVNSFSQLLAFVAANPTAVSTTSAGFNPLSTLGQQSTTMRTLLQGQGYSADEAYERTLAYIMKQAGVTLVKAPANSNSFKKIGIRQKVVNGNPVVDANNNPVYENADCP